MERNEKTYNYLFKKYWKEVFFYCRKRLHDEETAKDIAEEAFIKMWIHFEKFQSEENIKAFTYICAKNGCTNVFQTLARRHFVSTDCLSEVLILDPKWDFDIIETDVMSFILGEIKKLPLQKRRVIELLLAGYNSTEVANKLGNTRKTVLNTKLMVIERLRNLVKLKFGI